jgi:hypothetical protein
MEKPAEIAETGHGKHRWRRRHARKMYDLERRRRFSAACGKGYDINVSVPNWIEAL